jgi:hypothetical protein
MPVVGVGLSEEDRLEGRVRRCIMQRISWSMALWQIGVDFGRMRIDRGCVRLLTTGSIGCWLRAIRTSQGSQRRRTRRSFVHFSPFSQSLVIVMLWDTATPDGGEFGDAGVAY